VAFTKFPQPSLVLFYTNLRDAKKIAVKYQTYVNLRVMPNQDDTLSVGDMLLGMSPTVNIEDVEIDEI
jgi:hypothetical protein